MNINHYCFSNLAIRSGRFLVFVLVLVVLPSIVMAENDKKEPRGVGDFVGSEEEKNIDKAGPESKGSEDGSTSKNSSGKNDSGTSIIPEVWCGDISHAETQKICWRSYQKGLEYYETGLAHRNDVFAWQFYSSIVIFVVVLFLVGMGIYFAWVQFKAGEGSPESNEIEVSLTGVKVSSPILGVIILVLSLAFFYLYLLHVFPISEIF